MAKAMDNLVLMQTPEYDVGGIYFDEILIRADGLFVTSELNV